MPPSPAPPRRRQRSPHRTFTLITIHTAKCDLCNGRNTQGRLWRCAACGWSVCEACWTGVVVMRRRRRAAGRDGRGADGQGEAEEGGGIDAWHFLGGEGELGEEGDRDDGDEEGNEDEDDEDEYNAEDNEDEDDEDHNGDDQDNEEDASESENESKSEDDGEGESEGEGHGQGVELLIQAAKAVERG